MNYPAELYLHPDGLSEDTRQNLLADFLGEMEDKKRYFLGYQTNQDAQFHPQLAPFLSMNLLNLGDGFEEGSYLINSKKFERAVLHYYAKLCGFCGPHTQHEYWGYLCAMGSTEGNLFALWNARDYLTGNKVQDYPATEQPIEPVVICSAASHYSVSKACQLLQLKLFHQRGPLLGPCPVNQGDWQASLAVDERGAVDERDLYLLVAFFREHKVPVILLLNHGTTFSGGSDAISRILNTLLPILGGNNQTQRHYWIHVDGALAANFSPYLTDAPLTWQDSPFEFRHPAVMSMCLSPYKWLGAPWACGVYLMQARFKAGSDSRPSYVANRDSTISGSRQGLYALHLWDRIGALGHMGLQRIAQENEEKTQYLMMQLTKLAQQTSGFWVMPRQAGANIVRFTCPNSVIKARFSLAEQAQWFHGEWRQFCHVVVLSHVSYAAIDALIAALRDDLFLFTPNTPISPLVRYQHFKETK